MRTKNRNLLAFVFGILIIQYDKTSFAQPGVPAPKILVAGSISRQSFLNRIDYLFEATDKNNDGYISKKEAFLVSQVKGDMSVPFLFGRASFKKIDVSRDSKLSKLEFSDFARAVFQRSASEKTGNLDFSDVTYLVKYKKSLQ